MQTYSTKLAAVFSRGMSDGTTTIQVSMDTWRRLNARKQGPNETFDDVLQRLLDATEDD